MKRVVLCLLFSLAATPAFGQASCQTVGTSCGIPWLTCSGSPEVGESFSVEAPGTPGEFMLLVLGDVLPAPLQLPAPLACIPPGCSLYVTPSVLLSTVVDDGAVGRFQFNLPPNPALAGLNFGTQAVSLSPGQPCLYASPGLSVTIGA